MRSHGVNFGFIGCSSTRESGLQANDPMQRRVDREIDEYRLLMLGHKWWNIPTDLEQQRIDLRRDLNLNHTMIR